VNTEGHQPWALFAEGVIADVASSSYPVSFRCGGEPVETRFTVLAKENRETEDRLLYTGRSALPKGALDRLRRDRVTMRPVVMSTATSGRRLDHRVLKGRSSWPGSAGRRARS
jgi:hypothetical protein